MPKIEAQQTRRILDRLVGYLISPLLWKKIGRGLSAGRVQSVALRLICDREKEIRAFVAEEFWNVSARLRRRIRPSSRRPWPRSTARRPRSRTRNRPTPSWTPAKRRPSSSRRSRSRRSGRRPPPPYITSTLQQDAFRLLHYPVKKTMFVAQKLYEGLAIGELGQTGLITYMRTDSFRISDEARGAARSYIERTCSPAYVPSKPNFYKNKKKAQDAHEAIRPAHLDLPPEKRQTIPQERRNTTSTGSSGTGSSPRRWPRPSSRRPTSTSGRPTISSRPRARSSSSTASWPWPRTGTGTRTSCPRRSRARS